MGIDQKTEKLKNYLNQYGCELLNGTYSNRKDVITYRCKCGSVTESTIQNFYKKKKCRKCGYKQLSEKLSLTQEYVENYFKEYNCKLLTQYISSTSKLQFKCYCGHIETKTFHHFKYYPHCKKCGIKKMVKATTASTIRPDQEQRKKEKRISEYICYLFRRAKKNKSHKIFLEVNGYTVETFTQHIKSFNLQIDKWTIDHIFPKKAFFEHKIFNLKIINHLSNIQPLSRSENCQKNRTYNKEEFYKWLESIGYDDYEKQIQ